MIIRKFQKGDIREVGQVIADTYSKFNNEEGTKEAIKTYLDYYGNPTSKLTNSFLESICFVAIINDKIVGVIRAKKDRIINLFVDKEHHHQGIATKLLIIAEKELKKNGVNIIKIRSSIYAVEFYKKQDYKKTTGIRRFHDLKIQPMKKTVIKLRSC